MRLPWPFSRRWRRLALLDADAQVEQATRDRRRAEAAREEARKLGEWARQANLADRFGLRLEAAVRTRLGREGPR